MLTAPIQTPADPIETLIDQAWTIHDHARTHHTPNEITEPLRNAVWTLEDALDNLNPDTGVLVDNMVLAMAIVGWWLA